MRVISLCVLAGTLVSVLCELHSLTYTYTALSKEVHNPGIHEFTAMGLLDKKMIDYFDSKDQKKVPKQTWMKERLSEDYWNKGTESRKSKQQWFKVNLDILKDRMNQTDNELHVLQWMHGCEADLVDGKLEFHRGIDQYSYDGNSFLYYDDVHEVWVAAATEAEQTKRKWDEVQVLKDYTKGYLEKECVDWLRKFMEYGEVELKKAAPPEVFIFSSSSKTKSNVVLNCMATGFYPPDMTLWMKKNDRVLGEKDGLRSTGIRPNEDDTFQRRDSIEILRSDTSSYSCLVEHRATGVHILKQWDKVLPKDEDVVGGGSGVVVGGVIGALLFLVGLVVVVVVVKKRQGKIGKPDAVNKELGRIITAEAKPLVNPPNDDDSGKGSSAGSQDGSQDGSSDGSPDGSQDGSPDGSQDGSTESLDNDQNGGSQSSDTAMGSGEEESTPLNSRTGN